MENKPEGFDRANGQGQNHDTTGNVVNVGNSTLEQNAGNDKVKEKLTEIPDNDSPELENPEPQKASNKGQGPAGEDL